MTDGAQRAKTPYPTEAGDRLMSAVTAASKGWRGDINIPRLVREVEAEAEAHGRAEAEAEARGAVGDTP